MRFSKRSLHLPFAIPIEDRTAEHKDEHRDGEDDPTKAKAHVGRQPPHRQLPAVLHRFTSAAQGAASERNSRSSLFLPPMSTFPHGRWALTHFPTSPAR